MPESRFDRSEQQHPELDRFKTSRRSIGRIERGLVNHYSKKFNNEFDARLQSVQSQEKQHPILNHYSKTKRLNFEPKSNSASQMYPRSSTKNIWNDLGHDLDQLTKGNQHEVNLSPHPSLTIMVQPNKIDYTERSKYAIVVIKRSFHVLNIFEFLSFATIHYDETDPGW